MLFQNKKVAIDAEVGKKYLQGQRIGEIREQEAALDAWGLK
jgi:hypothetical protein